MFEVNVHIGVPTFHMLLKGEKCSIGYYFDFSWFLVKVFIFQEGILVVFFFFNVVFHFRVPMICTYGHAHRPPLKDTILTKPFHENIFSLQICSEGWFRNKIKVLVKLWHKFEKNTLGKRFRPQYWKTTLMQQFHGGVICPPISLICKLHWVS